MVSLRPLPGQTLAQGPSSCLQRHPPRCYPLQGRQQPHSSVTDDVTCNYTLSESVQSLSRVRLFVTPWTAARQASLSITNSQSWLKLMSIESVMPSNHLILCHPLLLPSIFPSFRVFFSESVLCIRWPKYWSFSFNASPSNDYSGLFSFRMDWFDLLAVQGTLRSLLQHHIKSNKQKCCQVKSQVSGPVPAHRWVCSHQQLSTSCTFSPRDFSRLLRVSLLCMPHRQRCTFKLCFHMIP